MLVKSQAVSNKFSVLPLYKSITNQKQFDSDRLKMMKSSSFTTSFNFSFNRAFRYLELLGITASSNNVVSNN